MWCGHVLLAYVCTVLLIRGDHMDAMAGCDAIHCAMLAAAAVTACNCSCAMHSCCTARDARQGTSAAMQPAAQRPGRQRNAPRPRSGCLQSPCQSGGCPQAH
jgi:hypothetical protein